MPIGSHERAERLDDLPPPAPVIFDAGERLDAGRVALSHLDAGGLEPLRPWLPGSLDPDWLPSDLDPHLDAGRCVLICDSTGLPIGLAVALLDAPLAGSAAVPFLAIDPARRFRGLGGEAGLALEEHLRRKFDMRRVLAPVPDGRGLAVYFWLRLGYRPIHGPEAPWPLAGLTPEPRPGIWMLREQVSAGSQPPNL